MLFVVHVGAAGRREGGDRQDDDGLAHEPCVVRGIKQELARGGEQCCGYGDAVFGSRQGRAFWSLGGLGLAGAPARYLGLPGGADAVEEDAGGLVGRVLGDELATEGIGEDGLVEMS